VNGDSFEKKAIAAHAKMTKNTGITGINRINQNPHPKSNKLPPVKKNGPPVKRAHERKEFKKKGG
jgi:hypothetical protein